MLEIQDTIQVEHNGVEFEFKFCDIFDIIAAQELLAKDVEGYYKWFFEQLISIKGIKHGLNDVTLDDLKQRTVKLPVSFLIDVSNKFRNKIITGKEIIDKDEAEKNA